TPPTACRRRRVPRRVPRRRRRTGQGAGSCRGCRARRARPTRATRRTIRRPRPRWVQPEAPGGVAPPTRRRAERSTLRGATIVNGGHAWLEETERLVQRQDVERPGASGLVAGNVGSGERANHPRARRATQLAALRTHAGGLLLLPLGSIDAPGDAGKAEIE